MSDYMKRYQDMINEALKSDDIVAYHGIVAGSDDIQKDDIQKNEFPKNNLRKED